MKSSARKIQPLSVVPAHQAPVKPLLSPEEKQFLDLLADIFVSTLSATNNQNNATDEESHRLRED
jgi:hypothetical protein